jgi:hypothetical protein
MPGAHAQYDCYSFVTAGRRLTIARVAANIAIHVGGLVKCSPMDSDDLTPEQAGAVYRALVGGMNYLLRLRTRMEKTGFLPNDRLYQMVCKAYDAMHRLSVDLHYRSCKSGVGRPSRDESQGK